jgi:hypothetical protein
MNRADELAYRLMKAQELLRTNGYVVIPNERRVVLHASYIISRFEMERAHNANRLMDAAVEDNLRCLIRKAFNDGLLSYERREDPENGDNIFTTLMDVIKPKGDDEV